MEKNFQGGGQEDFDIQKVIFTPAAEGHGLCPWGSTRDFFTKKRRPWSLFVDFREA